MMETNTCTWDNLTNYQGVAEFFRNSEPGEMAAKTVSAYADWCAEHMGADRAEAVRVLTIAVTTEYEARRLPVVDPERWEDLPCSRLAAILDAPRPDHDGRPATHAAAAIFSAIERERRGN